MFFNKPIKTFISILLACTLFGCASLTNSEKNMLYELKAVGIDDSEVQVKNPGTAGVLNLLPGFGNFYNAMGSYETDQWLVGFLNFLTWPISVLWGIPEAAQDAIVINQKETVKFYKYTPEGQKEFKRLKEKYGQE